MSLEGWGALEEARREALGLPPSDSDQLREFWNRQAEWSRSVFGSDQERGPQGPLKHLAKEVQEALADPTDLMEFVDMLFLVFDSTRRAGFTYDMLVEGAFKKLTINKARKWGAASATEAVEHIREGE